MSECSICFIVNQYQKFLKCAKDGKNHTFCEACIDKMAKSVNGQRSVQCPLCKTVTILPNGSAACLKTKFFVRLRCDDCFDLKPIDEDWWCNTCEKTICSVCAMKKHRMHQCSNWEDYEIPIECLKIFDKPGCDGETMKGKIRQFCKDLETALLAKVEVFEMRDKFVKSVRKGYGEIWKSSDNVPNFIDKRMLSEKRVQQSVQLTMQVLRSWDLALNDIEPNDLAIVLKDETAELVIPEIDQILRMFEKSADANAGPFVFEFSREVNPFTQRP